MSESASAYGQEDIVKSLIRKGADVNHANDFGWTPVMQAARNCHSNVVLELLRSRADVTCMTQLGTSALSAAVASKDAATVLAVLDALLERDSAATSDPLPLALAALGGSVSVASILQERGFHPGAPVPPSGLTPLMMAACNGHCAMVDWLLRRGASPNAVNAAGQTALDIAASKGYGIVETLLMKSMDLPSVTPLRSFGGGARFPAAWTSLGCRTQHDVFSPSHEDKLRVWSHLAELSVPQCPVSHNLRAVLSPCFFPAAKSSCHMQSVFSSGSCTGRSQHRCCSPLPSPRRLPEVCTPPHYCTCRERLPSWNRVRRMSQSDPNLSKKDKKSLSKWWKVTTEKLHSKVTTKKKSVFGSKTVKSLKFSSDNCHDSASTENVGQASGLANTEEVFPRISPCRNSVHRSLSGGKSDVENFLLSCGLQEYYHIFAEHEVDLHMIYSLNFEDLEEMGIFSTEEQIKILKLIITTKKRQQYN
ncbi:uncharacterized protein LOC134537201 isoform X2 [Bacillus rossius redtenbacheri]|uniref:uncharacterized protein LOC134537201 isoform X2 n=1 Tax=Bacillus rossius redtenbacheri TaxID=93214 RepID=UPI002FDE4704